MKRLAATILLMLFTATCFAVPGGRGSERPKAGQVNGQPYNYNQHRSHNHAMADSRSTQANNQSVMNDNSSTTLYPAIPQDPDHSKEHIQKPWSEHLTPQELRKQNIEDQNRLFEQRLKLEASRPSSDAARDLKDLMRVGVPTKRAQAIVAQKKMRELGVSEQQIKRLAPIW